MCAGRGLPAVTEEITSKVWGETLFQQRHRGTTSTCSRAIPAKYHEGAAASLFSESPAVELLFNLCSEGSWLKAVSKVELAPMVRDGGVMKHWHTRYDTRVPSTWSTLNLSPACGGPVGRRRQQSPFRSVAQQLLWLSTATASQFAVA